jgi:hypothetical protein
MSKPMRCVYVYGVYVYMCVYVYVHAEQRAQTPTSFPPEPTKPCAHLAVDGEAEGGGDGAVVGAGEAVAHLVGQELQLGPHVGQRVVEDAVGVGGHALPVSLLPQHVCPAQPLLLRWCRVS